MQREIIYESVENSWRECQKRCLAVETLEKTDFAVACNYWVWNPDTNRRYPRICSLSSGIFSDFFFFFQRNHVDFTSRSRAIFYFTFTSRSRFSVIFISLSFLEKSENHLFSREQRVKFDTEIHEKFNQSRRVKNSKQITPGFKISSF